MKKVLMKGNEAMALAAIKGGCDAFFGYPITPQNEISEYLSKYLKLEGKVFLQAESEIAAINMVYGAASTGKRVLTSSSSPGIALKQEGISYLCGAELPCLIINVMRGGPGLGGIQPAQSDYYQITRGGGNGDYHVLAYAPENLQETVDIIKESFFLADYYRNPVMVAVDGLIGQMMEPVNLDKEVVFKSDSDKSWALTGKKERTRHVVSSLYLDPAELEKHNLKLNKKYQLMINNEQKWEMINCENADMIIVAYGTMSRICRSAILMLKNKNINVGILRPITIWPFPELAFKEIPNTVKGIMVCELSLGQMIDDVKIANNGRLPVSFFGRVGGMLPEPEDIVEAIIKFNKEVSHGSNSL
ncbi:MAG: 3-methyl-2-oxobutanoate dehydrogenase subunit VorB [Bacilli bacterium]|jgi:2-oxoglutarate ferredoxin oxidoreductase subunit alpha|nr:3-methyl-2-oxobutanoate dehydrogenase subunit VorB [Bacilli bacterium]